MKKYLALGAALVFLLAPAVSLGAEFKAGEMYQLLRGQTVDGNLYAVGSKVTVEGDVNGDVVIAGGKLFIDGTVQDDVLAGGGTIQIGGTVNGDVRVAGGDVTITGAVNGEVVTIGGSLTISSAASIGGDLNAAGGDITLNGSVGGSVKVRSGMFTLNGPIQGSLDVKADKKVNIGSVAVVEGDFKYAAREEAQIEEGAQILGETSFTQTQARGRDHGGRKGFLAFLGIWFLVKFLSILFAGLLIFWLAKRYLQEFVDRVQTSFWKEVLRGFVTFIVIPIGGIILLVTIIGFVPAVAVFLAYGFVALLAKATAGILFGAYLQKWMDKTTVKPVSWKTVVGGTIALAILCLIPVAGWILGCVFFLAALGGWWHFLYSKFRSNVLS